MTGAVLAASDLIARLIGRERNKNKRMTKRVMFGNN